MRLRSHCLAVTLLFLLAGCTGADLTDPRSPESPETGTPGPGPSNLVGAVLYGTFLTNRQLHTSTVSFVVLDVDCVLPIQGVSAVNRLPAKKKFTYKYQLLVQRLPFQACVRVRNQYSFGPDDPPRMAETTHSVSFTPEGAGLAAVGVQVNLALP